MCVYIYIYIYIVYKAALAKARGRRVCDVCREIGVKHNTPRRETDHTNTVESYSYTDTDDISNPCILKIQIQLNLSNGDFARDPCDVATITQLLRKGLDLLEESSRAQFAASRDKCFSLESETNKRTAKGRPL